MIKKIIQVADIHIRKTMDNWEYEKYVDGLNRFIKECETISKPYEFNEVRIVICGDLFHNKNNISNDMDVLATDFIRSLETIAPVIIIAGNHDFNMNNLDQTHTISTFCHTRGFNNTTFLDEMLDYRSGSLTDENITWALYSAFDGFIKPDLTAIKQELPNNKIVGLFHDTIIGATMNNGCVADIGIGNDAFSDCDCVMCGHIHKRQVLRRNGIDIVYSGSLLQQDFGETTTQHGFCVWTIDNENNITHEFVDIKSEYGFFNLEANSLEDVDNEKIQILNL